jgi:hypothetical protein
VAREACTATVACLSRYSTSNVLDSVKRPRFLKETTSFLRQMTGSYLSGFILFIDDPTTARQLVTTIHHAKDVACWITTNLLHRMCDGCLHRLIWWLSLSSRYSLLARLPAESPCSQLLWHLPSFALPR